MKPGPAPCADCGLSTPMVLRTVTRSSERKTPRRTYRVSCPACGAATPWIRGLRKALSSWQTIDGPFRRGVN